MSRATGGARPCNESERRVGQRRMPRPPISALIDAPRQSNFRLRASFFAAIITTAATPDSHPDCRALLIKIVALQLSASRAGNWVRSAKKPLQSSKPRIRLRHSRFSYDITKGLTLESEAQA